ncbi:S-adenosyl-L-methionine-dependent methyltransferase [Auricularia subglabra TFB-10046 SS5]|nr:S-adenosyl-L-methionine-dependent methyltransferase [Auricularia subglabra TFB-10046 SS5]
MLRRCLSTWRPPTFAPLPPVPEWAHIFGHQRDRAFVHNVDTAGKLAAAFLKDTKRPKTIIEAYPGAGILTRALLQYPPDVVKKIIVLEDHRKCYTSLKSLEEQDDRVRVVERSGFQWATYSFLEAEGHMQDVEVADWADDAALQFVAHIPHTVQGDQLMSQLFRAIPERAWLFKYGRVRMSCVLSEALNERIMALNAAKARCKLSVIARATCDVQVSLAAKDASPYGAHFYPLPYGERSGKTTGSKRTGTPHLASTFTPLVKPLIAKGDMEKWDYITRALFVRKSNSLGKVLPSLAPGAENLVTALISPDTPEEDRVDPTKLVTNLTERDWQNVVKAFNNWPFAPDVNEM